MDGDGGETSIFYVMIWNHPVETTMTVSAPCNLEIPAHSFFALQKGLFRGFCVLLHAANANTNTKLVTHLKLHHTNES